MEDPSPVMSPLCSDLEFELKNSIHASTPIYLSEKENYPPDAFKKGFAPNDFGTEEELEDISKVIPQWHRK